MRQKPQSERIETRRLPKRDAERCVRQFKAARGSLSIRQIAKLNDLPFSRVRVEIARARRRGELGDVPPPNPLVPFIHEHLSTMSIEGIAGALVVDRQTILDLIAIHDLQRREGKLPAEGKPSWPECSADPNAAASWGPGFGRWNLVDKSHPRISP